MAGETLSLKCSCGYIKHDVMHLGVWQDSEQTMLKYCGGLFLIDGDDGVICKKCGIRSEGISFHCAFCSRVTVIPVKHRVAASAGRATTIQMSVHKTVIFSIQ